MYGQNEENLKELFERFFDAEKAERAVEDVEKAEERIRVLERKQDTNNAKAEAERGAIKEKIDDTKLKEILTLLSEKKKFNIKRR